MSDKKQNNLVSELGIVKTVIMWGISWTIIGLVIVFWLLPVPKIVIVCLVMFLLGIITHSILSIIMKLKMIWYGMIHLTDGINSVLEIYESMFKEMLKKVEQRQEEYDARREENK